MRTWLVIPSYGKDAINIEAEKAELSIDGTLTLTTKDKIVGQFLHIIGYYVIQ